MTGLHNVFECWNLKQRYPMVSMADRLSYETKRNLPAEKHDLETAGEISHEALPNALTSEAMVKLDRMYEPWSENYHVIKRAEALKYIHDSQVEQFVSSPGFGISRMLPSGAAVLQDDSSPDFEFVSPDKPYPSDGTSGEDGLPPGARPPAIPDVSYLESLHGGAQTDFANVSEFGYVQDPMHVAGFQSHRMTRWPDRSPFLLRITRNADAPILGDSHDRTGEPAQTP